MKGNQLSLLSFILFSFISVSVYALKGGPDTYGYTYIGSDEAGGPTYDFVDISSSGTALSLGDDQSKSISLTFDFEFYGVTYNSV